MREALTTLQADTLTTVMGRGKRNPITGKEIASVIGLKPRRTGKEGADMRAIVHALRCKGYPICASGNGYWWPANHDQLADYVRAFDGRIMQQAEAVAGMKFGYDKISMAAARQAIEKSTQVFYEAMVEGQRRCFKVRTDRLPEFLLKYPDAKKA